MFKLFVFLRPTAQNHDDFTNLKLKLYGESFKHTTTRQKRRKQFTVHNGVSTQEEHPAPTSGLHVPLNNTK